MNIIEKMNESPVVFDGAMGIMIYSRGVFINRCFDEICLTDPDLICDIHQQYIDAGAEYAITQPIFDAEFMKNEVPGVEVPDSILERMRKCTTREDGFKMGCEIGREIRESISDSVAGFQVSAPFGKVELAIDVLS
jgi:homocysteine S-methyltransferase